MADRALQRHVARGEDVRMARCKQQVDLGRPGPDTGNPDHPADRLIGVEPAEVVQVESFLDSLRYGQKRPLLGPRQAGGAEHLLAGHKHSTRRQRIDQSRQSAEDRIGARS
jgi:hypothetical protein